MIFCAAFRGSWRGAVHGAEVVKPLQKLQQKQLAFHSDPYYYDILKQWFTAGSTWYPWGAWKDSEVAQAQF